MPTSRFGIPMKTVSAIEHLQLRQAGPDGVGRGLPETANRCVAHRLRDIAQQHHIPVWCGGMLESGIGRVHNIAISTLPNFSLPGDVSASRRYWKEDIIEPEVEVSKKGTITVKDEPGMGYQIKEDLIEKLTVRQLTLKKQ